MASVQIEASRKHVRGSMHGRDPVILAAIITSGVLLLVWLLR
jgi:hypothetical protein